jgi:toxin HigB-1
VLWPAIRRKLDMINAAQNIGDLRAPPGNRLEQLRGDRAGRYSIRVNDQIRIIFRYKDPNSYDVICVDYH